MRISDNLVITRVLFSYGADSQNLPNRFYMVSIIPEFRLILTVLGIWKGMEGIGMGTGKGLELGGIFVMLQLFTTCHLWKVLVTEKGKGKRQSHC
jgi:hypothetical protein